MNINSSNNVKDKQCQSKKKKKKLSLAAVPLMATATNAVSQENSTLDQWFHNQQHLKNTFIHFVLSLFQKQDLYVH